ASISRRSRSSPPSRRNAAKNWAGNRTSGSNSPASRSCPAENPRLPFATIPPPLTGPHAHPAHKHSPYHAPQLQKELDGRRQASRYGIWGLLFQGSEKGKDFFYALR